MISRTSLIGDFTLVFSRSIVGKTRFNNASYYKDLYKCGILTKYELEFRLSILKGGLK